MRMGSVPAMHGDRSGGHGARARAGADLPKKKPNLKKVMPEIWKLVRPRGRWLLGFGFLAHGSSTGSLGLVLPFSTKFPHRLGVLGAHGKREAAAAAWLPLSLPLLQSQAVTSFLLTQLLSKVGAEDDHRVAAAGPAACRPAVGQLLRRQPHRSFSSRAS